MLVATIFILKILTSDIFYIKLSLALFIYSIHIYHFEATFKFWDSASDLNVICGTENFCYNFYFSCMDGKSFPSSFESTYDFDFFVTLFYSY